ncbi:hypothetical protein CVT26_012316 [Gymnopilus dilepis]|nr:hypothetical protein CVT26_012316 [Gymnopilus dilepis]
MEKEAGG